jgi:SSS family solute:Na+ symporter
MSTLDSELFVSGVTLGPDIMGRVPLLQRLGDPVLTRIGMAIVTVLSICFAIFVPSVVDMYYTIGTMAVPGLLLPVLSCVGLVPRISSQWLSVHLAAVPLVTGAWYCGMLLLPGKMPSIEPFYPGCAASCIIWALGALCNPRR